MENKLISIAMATYNGQNYLKEQLDSIINQSYRNIEIIISDDGSTDKTLELLEEYKLKDKRIKVYKNYGKHGFSNNFFNALKYCNGEYIAFSDQDDIWTLNHIEVLYNNIGNNDLIGANAELINHDGSSQKITMKDVLRLKYVPNNNENLFFHLLFGNLFQGSTLLFSKELYEKYNNMPDNIKFHDHWLAILASANNGAKYIDDIVLKYRQHQTNVTSNKKTSFIKRLFNHFFIRKRKKEAYVIKQAMEILLNELLKVLSEKYKNVILQTRRFINNEMSKKEYKDYFLRNYEIIFVDSKKNDVIFFVRYIKYIFLKGKFF